MTILLMKPLLTLNTYQEAKASQYYQHVSPIYGTHRSKYIYAVTITPKGKGVTLHSQYSHELREAIRTVKSVRKAYLFKESEYWPHFHGIIITNRQTKLLKLTKRNKLFHCKVELIYSDNGIRYWMRYIMKQQKLGDEYYYYQHPSHNFTTCQLDL